MPSPTSYLTRRNTKAVGLAAFGAIGVVNTLFGGWDNLNRVAELDWTWLRAALDSPWPFVVIFVGAVWWLAKFGDRREPAKLDWVPVHGLHWRYQRFSRDAVNPYPYCPTHDVPLFWQGDTRSQGGFQRELMADDYVGSDSSAHLRCPDAGGHDLSYGPALGWKAEQARLAAAGLIERLERTRPVRSVVS